MFHMQELSCAVHSKYLQRHEYFSCLALTNPQAFTCATHLAPESLHPVASQDAHSKVQFLFAYSCIHIAHAGWNAWGSFGPKFRSACLEAWEPFGQKEV
eukprot:3476935-Amphidinium_carterae.2